jgi:CheY-like chemotaxis protein
MKTDNNNRLRRELRLAQMEIKALREQLLKSIQEARTTQEEMAKLAEHIGPQKTEKKVIVPIVPFDSPAPQGSPPNGQPRVLCVEDNESNFRLIERILQDRPKTELVWADTGEKGLEMARDHVPKLVLLDLDLPDMHGSKVLEGLQAQPETANTPVVVVSADATPSQIERMLLAGARNYLTKPFDIRRFLCVVDEVLAGT